MTEAIQNHNPVRLNGRYDYRHHCGRLLFRAHLPIGTVVEIRCPKCNQMYVLKVAEEMDGAEPASEDPEEEGGE